MAEYLSGNLIFLILAVVVVVVYVINRIWGGNKKFKR